MPHLFVNRQRRFTTDAADALGQRQFRWETFNTAAYLIGGIVFIIGSVLFFPAMAAYADLGALVFLFGSVLYLVVTGQDLVEVLRHRHQRQARTLWDQLELAAAVSYVVGTLLFLAGSLFFMSFIGLFISAAWAFVFGSSLFIVGAIINVLQIIQAPGKVTLQLMNLTAISFIAGSLLFAVASVPYLWRVDTEADRVTINTFLAWQYLIGSVLFLAGGSFNYWRALIVTHHGLNKHTHS